MTPPRILIVEDEPKIAALLRDCLRAHGFDTAELDRGDAVVPWLAGHAADLVLLDVMLPGLSGLDVCRQLRAQSGIPVILLTARVEEIDRLLGLSLGADDYICKPFSPLEVAARIKTVLRRCHRPASAAASGLHLDADTLHASWCGRPLDLTAVEFELLATLARHPGRIFRRQELMDAIYPDRRVVSDRTIDSHINKLRRKLETASPDRALIQAVYSVGYKFEPEQHDTIAP